MKTQTVLRWCLAAMLMALPLSAQPSRIELKTFFSATLSRSMQFNILLPEGYDSEDDRYPVVYLFRGAVDEWADPSEDNSRRGTIKTVYDTLISRNRIGRMILVMPGLGAPAPQNEYVYLINELLPHIDANYRTIPTRWHRSMDGFSLGGLIVTNLMAAAPQKFVSAGSYDGTLSLFDNSLFTNASPQLVYAIKQMQLLYHTASVGGNNHNNNMTTFGILNAKGIFNALPSYGLDPNAQHNWYYADRHMAITLPMHWAKMQSAANALSVSFKAPSSGNILAGMVPVAWTRSDGPDTARTRIWYSSDDGAAWTLLHSSASRDSTVQWNTLLLKDGTRYRLKAAITSDTLFGSSVTGPFTVNNPGNGAPDLSLTGLRSGDTVSGAYQLSWNAADADGDPLSVDLACSFDAGTTWQTFAEKLMNSGTFLYPTFSLPNSETFRFRIRVSDGSVVTEQISPPLILHNARVPLRNASFTRIAGASDPVLQAFGMHRDSLNTADYTILFHVNGEKRSYSVLTINGTEVVKEATTMDGTTEGPLFNGFRLLVKDHPVPVIAPEQCRWLSGTSPLEGVVNLLDINLEGGTVIARPTPADYEVRIGAVTMDTTLSLFGLPAQPVPFTVWNVTEKRKTPFLFIEIDGTPGVSRNDEIYLFERDSAGTPQLSWHLQFVGNENAANPQPGDIYFVKVLKPVAANDAFRFTFTPPLTVRSDGSVPGSFSLAQNFPNPFNPATTFRYSLARQAFTSLRIYDLIGREVARLVEHQQDPGNYSLTWDASRHAAGIYFASLRSGTEHAVRKVLLVK